MQLREIFSNGVKSVKTLFAQDPWKASLDYPLQEQICDHHCKDRFHIVQKTPESFNVVQSHVLVSAGVATGAGIGLGHIGHHGVQYTERSKECVLKNASKQAVIAFFDDKFSNSSVPDAFQHGFEKWKNRAQAGVSSPQPAPAL